MSRRPAREEYADFYAGYVSLVPEGDLRAILVDQLTASLELFASIPPSLHHHRYAPGKWTVQQVIGHVVDCERIFSCRALCFARGDAGPLPGMDQERFMAGAKLDRRPFSRVVDEYRHLRSANLALIADFDEDILDRVGVASGCRFTVRSLLFILAGHERHHVAILRDRYL